MSIVSLADGSSSNFTAESLQDLAAQLNIELPDGKDADDYLRLLWSFEAVMKQVDDGPDYIHPTLQPQAVLDTDSSSKSSSRHYWKPTPEENPLNAWSHRCDLRAAQPTSAVLQGRTVAIKDNISVAGLPTTLGAPAVLVSDDNNTSSSSSSSSFPISPIDAVVVARLLSAGATIKGTSTCECFCASPLSFTSASGPVHNPRLHGYTAGGSSSGSCALVAAHMLTSSSSSSESHGPFGEMAELAIGSDQAGSVRIPAAYNGLYGLKPTFGLVPYTGAASMSPMIDHLGPIAARLEDLAALLEVMAGYDGLDSRMTPESPLVGSVKPYARLLADFRSRSQTQTAQGCWKIGLLKESFLLPSVAPEVRDTVLDAAKRFFAAAGATVVEVSVPLHTEAPVIWTAATRPSMSSWLCQGRPGGHLSYLPPHLGPSRWPPSQKAFAALHATNPALANIIFTERFAQRGSSSLPPGIEAKAHRKVFELREAYDKVLEEVDVLITPCAPTVAMPHPPEFKAKTGEEGEGPSVMERLTPAIGLTSNTCPFNVTGHPALSVPCGFGSRSERPDVRLPIGMQIVGRRWGEETVLNAAALFERGREIASASP